MQRKILILLGLLFLSFPTLRAENGVEDLSNVSLGRIKLPIYNNGKLQLFIFADNAVRPEQVLISKNTYIDLLCENADVDRVLDGWDTVLYPLSAPLPEVLKFWTKRYLTSQAVLFSSLCHLDTKTGNAFGDSPVYLRSPMMDLNGIGFQSDFNTKTTLVNADVRIVLRTEESDPREILSGNFPPPRVYRTIGARGDSLRIDVTHNELMLIGNVKVIDGNDTLECDRLTAFLHDREDSKKDPAKSGMLKGVERVLADGSVVLIHRSGGDEKPLRAEGEHLEYEISSGIITLTDEEQKPKILQGSDATLTGGRIELLRDSGKAFVSKGCCVETLITDAAGKVVGVRKIISDQADFDNNANLGIFSGNVHLTDPQAELDCDRMRFFLRNAAAGIKGFNEFSPVGGKRELDRVLCDGNVHVREVISPLPPAPAGKKGKETKIQLPSELTSDHGEFDYRKDRFIFTDRVRGRRGDSTLSCDRLDLFLADKESAPKAKANVPIGGEPGKNKTLRKVIASGHVITTDKDNELATELMTLHFQELPDGAKGAPGMFQSGNVRLTRIICDGSVVATNKQKPPADLPEKEVAGEEDDAIQFPSRTIRSQHAISDLSQNLTEFHEKVSVTDPVHRIDCRDMYVFTGRALPPPDAKKLSPEELDPDYDPFALDESEDSAPARISLAPSTNLYRIVCKNDVLLTRTESQGITQAGGDKAVYTVATKEIVITAEPPARPYLRGHGRKQFCDRIIGNLATEELKGLGSSEVMPDKE